MVMSDDEMMAAYRRNARSSGWLYWYPSTFFNGSVIRRIVLSLVTVCDC